MEFKIGQQVKYLLSINNTWANGEVSRIVGNFVSVDENVFLNSPDFIKPLHKMSPKDLEDWARENIGNLFLMIRDALHTFFPNLLMSFQINENPLEIRLGDLSMADITIEPTITEVMLADCFQEVPAWLIIVWRHLPGTRVEPPIWEDDPVGKFQTNQDAAGTVLDTVWSLLTEAYWHNIQEDAHYNLRDDGE